MIDGLVRNIFLSLTLTYRWIQIHYAYCPLQATLWVGLKTRQRFYWSNKSEAKPVWD